VRVRFPFGDPVAPSGSPSITPNFRLILNLGSGIRCNAALRLNTIELRQVMINPPSRRAAQAGQGREMRENRGHRRCRYRKLDPNVLMM
jgi:hypothetical protein